VCFPQVTIYTFFDLCREVFATIRSLQIASAKGVRNQNPSASPRLSVQTGWRFAAPNLQVFEVRAIIPEIFPQIFAPDLTPEHFGNAVTVQSPPSFSVFRLRFLVFFLRFLVIFRVGIFT
jgi:hypothetical protein